MPFFTNRFCGSENLSIVVCLQLNTVFRSFLPGVGDVAAVIIFVEIISIDEMHIQHMNNIEMISIELNDHGEEKEEGRRKNDIQQHNNEQRERAEHIFTFGCYTVDYVVVKEGK